MPERLCQFDSLSSADHAGSGLKWESGNLRSGVAYCTAFASLERDDFSLNRHPALASCLSMIFSENRCTLFGIML